MYIADEIDQTALKCRFILNMVERDLHSIGSGLGSPTIFGKYTNTVIMVKPVRLSTKFFKIDELR